MRQIKIRHYCLAGLALLVLTACGGDSGDARTEQTGEILFAPTAGVVPSPNDLAFQGSADATLDGTGNESLDALDGFSTLAPVSASSTVKLAPGSVVGNESVHLFEVTTTGDPNSTSPDPAGPKPVDSVDARLTPGTDYNASVSPADRNGRQLAITPLRPLDADTTYMVVLTNDLRSSSGDAISASSRYELTRSTDPLVDGSGNSNVDSLSDSEATELEGVRQLVQSQLAAAGGEGIDTSGIIASWTFTTQNIGPVLAEVQTLLGSATINAPSVTDTGEDTPDGAASIWVGVLTGVPYYLAEPADAYDPAPTEEFWEADTEVAGERHLTGENPTPRERTTVDIPFVITIPNAGCGGCPVALFQHGIGTNRKSALAVADALAGMPTPHATVAIDLPLHGITDTDDPLYAGDENSTLQPAYNNLGDIERTFELDLVDGTGAPGPDGQIDASGEHFVNLASLRTSRDNLRQAVADLLMMNEEGLDRISAIVNAESVGAITLDSTDVDYVGQSLGGMVGVPFLARAGGDINRAVLSVPGGGTAKLLDGSPTLGHAIEAGLESNGLTKGTPAYEQFLGVAQTSIDTGEPLNYAATAVGNQDTLMFEVVGGNSSPADQVVPNNLMQPYQQGIPTGTIPSPTAGTDPLAGTMGLTQIGPANEPGGADTIVRFTAGAHPSLVQPDASAAVTTEMQKVMATFLENATTEITDGSVVEDP